MSKRICIFGSSIAQGYRDYTEGGWGDRLKLDYMSGDKFEIYNLGINGDTSDGVVKRFRSEYKARRADIILIAIGMNDSLFDKSIDNNWVKINDSKENFEKIIKFTQNQNIKIGFIGLTKIVDNLLSPVPWNENLYYNTDSVIEYDKIIKKVAKENNIPFCPMYDLLNDKDLDDGLHPNSQGHKKMFLRVRDFLKEEFN